MIIHLKKKFKEGVEIIELNSCFFETYYPFYIYSKGSNNLKIIRIDIDEYFEIISKPLIPLSDKIFE
jgi:hypothetical protein